MEDDGSAAFVLAVSGYRNMSDWSLFEASINEYILKEIGHQPTKIVSGGAKGADAFARRFAQIHKIPLVEYKPEWKKYGKAAGPMRNADIIGGETTHLIAFPHPSGRGTQDAIAKAKKRGIPVKVVDLSATGGAGGR